MNLTQPPFDDVHVRKAMNWIMDKAALQKAWGGPIPGVDRDAHRPAGALQQPARRLRPVRDAERRTGSVAKAKAEMKESKYDPGKTGKCTRVGLQGRAD